MHRLVSTLAVAASIALAACGGGTDDATVVDTGMGAMPPAPPAAATTDTAMAGQGDLVADTEAAANALEGGVANVPLTTAGPLLERIERSLSGTGDAALGEISGDLGRLRAALTGGTATGAEIGTMLSELGRKVTAYAPNAPAGARPLLDRLATALSSQGSQLGGQ